MNFLVFVLLVLLITTVGGAATALMRRGPRKLDDDAGSPHYPHDPNALAIENQELKSQISAMEDRIRVLERIATDASVRTAVEIENLP
jgi:TolA-binding protein